MTIPTDSSRNDWADYSLKLEGVIGGLSADLAAARARIAALEKALTRIADDCEGTAALGDGDEPAISHAEARTWAAVAKIARAALAEPGKPELRQALKFRRVVEREKPYIIDREEWPAEQGQFGVGA